MEIIYETPVLSVVKFETDDVITTSTMGFEPEGPGGETAW